MIFLLPLRSGRQLFVEGLTKGIFVFLHNPINIIAKCQDESPSSKFIPNGLPCLFSHPIVQRLDIGVGQCLFMHHVVHLLDQVALGISVSAQATRDALLLGLRESAVVEDLQA